MSILAQITRHRVITLTPVAVVDEPVQVDDLFALFIAVGLMAPSVARAA